jgi:glutamate-1-semialdehyde 2,1-aminomutase
VRPDLTTFGKIIGGGMPVGAFGGRAEIMAELAPIGPVYQAGTLSGNPVAMAAGLKTLELISRDGFYAEIDASVSHLTQGLTQAAKTAGVPFITQQVGGMFGLFFTERESVSSFADLGQCDVERFNRFFNAMLVRGIYFAPSSFEAGFVSSAHSEQQLDQTIEAASESFSLL